MPRKEKETGYSAPALARRLILMRAEASRMGVDGRMYEDAADLCAEQIDQAIEEIFCGYLQFLSEKREYPFERENWDRTKWEKRIVAGMNGEPYKSRYLERAELHKGGIWAGSNYAKA